MLSRCALNGQPALIFQSPHAVGVYVTIWNMPTVRASVPGTPAFIATDKHSCVPNLGTPIPPSGWPFTIYLSPGEELWGTAYDEALLGVSCGPVE